MSEIRIVGVDDGAFQADRKHSQRALILAVLFQGLRILAVRIGSIDVDGSDANSALVCLLRSMRFDAIMLSGISFGGFNLVNIERLAHDLHNPVIAVTGERPDNASVRRALRGHFADWRERWQIVVTAGPVYSCKPLKDEPRLYFEVKGASYAFARELIKATAIISRLPEPIRVAGILARGLST